MNLQRFLIAQDGKRNGRTLYENALIEIQEGELTFECWIRYVYPQLKRKNRQTYGLLWFKRKRRSTSIYRASYIKRKIN